MKEDEDEYIEREQLDWLWPALQKCVGQRGTVSSAKAARGGILSGLGTYHFKNTLNNSKVSKISNASDGEKFMAETDKTRPSRDSNQTATKDEYEDQQTTLASVANHTGETWNND
jgi:hypothetical protein